VPPQPLQQRVRVSALLQVLLDAGAFVDVGSAEGTPLMCAARSGHAEAAKLLLDRDADACALFELKKTAGAVAEEAGHREVAALLAAAAAPAPA
jgi:ankyrin repeat protein